MKHLLILVLLAVLIACTSAIAQKQPSKSASQKEEPKGNAAIVVDERLSLLLSQPSLYALPIQRMRRGRQLKVLRSKVADGVTFYEVKPSSRDVTGWVQAEAIIGNFRRDDDQRLAKLVQASRGFAQIERAVFFLNYFPKSKMRPSILLLIGDLVEEEALALSKKAGERLDRREMAASGAPLHSFYLNFSGLDRYRKLGIRFLFNINTRSYHYDGGAWFELLSKFKNTLEAQEAQRRLATLKEKMERDSKP
ncbi:MAG: hypothetical protein HKN25_04250 [Pyrinomonadaceae bacterium]|nr:hypothetical protein [Pyrinomonadaceae bacterium]